MFHVELKLRSDNGFFGHLITDIFDFGISDWDWGLYLFCNQKQGLKNARSYLLLC